MDNEHTQDGAEPVAWMVEWTDHSDFFLHRPDAEMVAAGDMAVQSLYRAPQPALTDAERKAISAAACICEDAGRTDIAIAVNTALERLG